MFQLFRFIQKIDAAVSPTFNSLITVGDTVLNVFSKLQGLLAVRAISSNMVTQYTGGASTTADQSIGTLTIPASHLSIGDLLHVDVHGRMTKPFSNGTTINFWIKINGTKACIMAYQPTGGLTAQPFEFDASMVCRTVGAATGSIYTHGSAVVWTTATAGINIRGTETSQTVDTTAAIVITVGYNFSNSNASNNITSNLANIHLE